MAETAEQLTLPLFEPLSFNDLIRTESIKDITVILNPRLRSNWYVRRIPWTRILHLYVPRRYDSASVAVKHAIIEWARIAVRSRLTPTVRAQKRLLEKTIFSLMETSGITPSKNRTTDPQKFDRATRGAVYDLREVFDTVNRNCFKGSAASKVRWGGYATTTSYQSNKKDRDGVPFSLITIAGVYDHHDVPRFAIESVMHHEILHIIIPPVKTNGRRSVHSRLFSATERQFAHYKQWYLWERENLHRLARSMRRKRVRSR